MGSKPSGMKGGVVVAASVEGAATSPQVAHVPKQVQTASAPPTPLRPDGAPPEAYGADPFPPPPGAGNGQEAYDDGLDCEAAMSVRKTVPSATHSGVSGGWPAAPAASPLGAAAGGAASSAAAASSRPAAPPPQEGSIAFDVPLEEVLQRATEAFGSIASALSSPKWDRRVQALKGVGTVLKGLDLKAKEDCRGLKLRDNAACFRAACLVLNVALRDKVLPVLFAAHDLYRVTFEHGSSLVPREEASHAMDTLLQHILAKLGELNIRLHESACAAFVFSAGPAPRLALPAALGRLQRHLEDCPMRGQQRMRVHAGVLDAVSHLLRLFPARRPVEGSDADAAATWTTADVAPFVVAGTQVDAATGTRVRQAAASLAVVVYTTLGRPSLDDLMLQLPEPSQEIVKLKIEEETGMLLEDGDFADADDDGEDGDEIAMGGDMSDLCVMGVALKPPTASKPAVNLAKTDGHEEDFMDEILEETGMVFQGTGLLHANCKESSVSNHALDEDLRNLGLLDGPMLLN